MNDENETIEELVKAAQAKDWRGTEWEGEDWLSFYWIVEKIAEGQDIPKGPAERILRELCASGDVRSIKGRDVSEEDAPEDIARIRPSEWTKDQVDLTVDLHT
jgi:hypothetical protein